MSQTPVAAVVPLCSSHDLQSERDEGSKDGALIRDAALGRALCTKDGALIRDAALGRALCSEAADVWGGRGKCRGVAATSIIYSRAFRAR
jgi:hypothetical protein